ncbi:hypothetical protein IU498_06410 [Nocardia beijingensis]|uniref:hypothetical protein n=1 Tax=Nocardia beijingensis TaxID=95162 RepID=UPI0018934BBB|nr:hypothetical protein [Nocardia beijingensis]MBF6074263.1 hypothetical protein [Nocardia beijingensis]
MTRHDAHRTVCPICAASTDDAEAAARIARWLDPLGGLPAEVGGDHFGLTPAAFDIFVHAFGVDHAGKARTLAQTHDLARAYLAPFVLKVALDMLGELLRALRANPDTAIVFLGRDGFVFGYVVAALMPEFYAAHCVAMYLPRHLADAALRDQETTEAGDFSEVAVFRKSASPAPDATGAQARLTAYFAAHGIAILDKPAIHFVDSGFKGSIQEMLAAAYRADDFFGHYAFHATSASDPHPGSKRGYALHLDSVRGRDGLALRTRLPEDPALTFQHHEAVVAFESMIAGSKSSPTAFDSYGRPQLRRRRHEARPLDGLNPALIAADYTDPLLREAVAAMNIFAIVQYARDVAPALRAAGPAWYETVTETPQYARLTARSVALRDQIRAWVARSPAVHPEFAALLDAFAPRTDKDVIRELDRQLRSAGTTEEQRDEIWRTVTELYLPGRDAP